MDKYYVGELIDTLKDFSVELQEEWDKDYSINYLAEVSDLQNHVLALQLKLNAFKKVM